MLLAITVVALTVAFGFNEEAKALAWHAGHGFSWDYENVRMRIPLYRRVSCRGAACRIIPAVGRLRSQGNCTDGVCVIRNGGTFLRALVADPEQGAVLLLPARKGSFEEQRLQASKDADGNLIRSRSVEFAGVTLTCDEYPSKRTQRVVMCFRQSPGPTPMLYGAEASLPSLYSLLETARSR